MNKTTCIYNSVGKFKLLKNMLNSFNCHGNTTD